MAVKKIFELVRELKSNGSAIAIDITPGRRALVAAAIIVAMKINIDHIYYLAIKSTEDADRPYMMIPLQIQQIHDFMEATRKVVK